MEKVDNWRKTDDLEKMDDLGAHAGVMRTCWQPGDAYQRRDDLHCGLRKVEPPRESGPGVDSLSAENG